MQPAFQTVASSALGGTGGCDPSNIRATAPIILGGTGGCEPSSDAALGGTGGCGPSSMAAKLLCDGALPGATLATSPQITNKNTTVLAVRFIAISSFLVLRALKRAATIQVRSRGSVAWREMLGIQSRNRGKSRIRREAHGQ